MTAGLAARQAPAEISVNRTESSAAAWPWWVVLLCAALVVYVWTTLDSHWVADDEGLLGQTAERVLAGELPHRDFVDTYTGGLSLIHALAFRVLGTDLLSLRLLLLLCVAAWIPVLYACAARFLPPGGAAVATILAVTWSIPNYPAAMPSWYNLFFATFGLLALLRHAESDDRRWLIAAGIAGGLSVTIKISGLFFVAAAMLYLVARSARPSLAREKAERRGAWAYMVVAGLACFAGAIAMLVWRSMSPAHAYHFVVPTLALTGVLAIAALRTSGGGSAGRLRLLAADAGALLAGTAIPVALLAARYAAADAVPMLVRGVFVAPTSRLAEAAWSPPPLGLALPAIVTGLLLMAMVSAPARLGWVAAIVAGIVAGAAWLGAGAGAAYGLGWLTLSQFTPLITLVGAILLAARWRDARTSEADWCRTYACLAVAAVCSLIQYPFAAPIYFCYIAPLMTIGTCAVWRLGPARRGGAMLAVAFLFIAFSLFWLNGRGEGAMWYGLRPRPALVPLGIPRASLKVPAPDAHLYRAVIRELGDHARGGYTYAGPDVPEIYFLSGLHNPTRTLFEFIEPDQASPSLEELKRLGVTAVVINRYPKFSRPLGTGVQAMLMAEFPLSLDIGKFTVRWKE